MAVSIKVAAFNCSLESEPDDQAFERACNSHNMNTIHLLLQIIR